MGKPFLHLETGREPAPGTAVQLLQVRRLGPTRVVVPARHGSQVKVGHTRLVEVRGIRVVGHIGANASVLQVEFEFEA